MAKPLVIYVHNENKTQAATCCLNDAQRNILTVFLFPRNSIHWRRFDTPCYGSKHELFWLGRKTGKNFYLYFLLRKYDYYLGQPSFGMFYTKRCILFNTTYWNLTVTIIVVGKCFILCIWDLVFYPCHKYLLIYDIANQTFELIKSTELNKPRNKMIWHDKEKFEG